MCVKKRICLCEGSTVLGRPASRRCVLYIIYKTEIKNKSPSSSKRIYVFSFEVSFKHYILYDKFNEYNTYIYIYLYIYHVYQSGLVPLHMHTLALTDSVFNRSATDSVSTHKPVFPRSPIKTAHMATNPADHARA